MQQIAQKQKYISVKEYFEMEETDECKNEFYHGEIFAMSGATHHHNVISINTSSALHNALKDSDCFVYGGDMKIQVDKDKHYTYPDINIVCGDIEFVKNRNDTIINPVVIIEILSDSTKDYDRGGKFTAYRNIPALKDYIIIDQFAYYVEYFHKDETGRWILNEYKQLTDTFRIQSVDVELSLDTIYHRVKLAPAG